ncbi:MAG TPA: carboxypeptidase-like regulatory domain-containing protein, partial [Planctomycetota bacterium]|nr:carboxypeptidase-like regulatory domain-containing protein [Planctomycetota bacterium]
ALGGIELLLESEAEVIDVPLPLAPHRELVQTINRYLGARHARTRSGPDGRFVFPHVGAGKQRISVSAPGLLPLLRSFEVEWSEAYDLGVLRLDRGKIVRGVVRAADGSPISEARVLAMQTDPGMFGFGSAMKDTLTGRITTASGPDGTFVLSGLGPHAYTVAAIAPGFGRGEKRVSRPEDTEEAWVEILLEPGVTIRGRVIDEVTGDPISGARVNAQEVRSETDAEGRFVLEGVPRARSPFGGRGPRRERSPEDEADETATSPSVRIEVARKGYVQVRERVSLDDLGREVEIELRRVPAIRGIVYDSAGDPAPGVLVRLSVDVPREMRDAGFFDTSLIFFAASITTLDGTFRFEDFRALPAEVPLCVIADSPGRPQARS